MSTGAGRSLTCDGDEERLPPSRIASYSSPAGRTPCEFSGRRKISSPVWRPSHCRPPKAVCAPPAVTNQLGRTELKSWRQICVERYVMLPCSASPLELLAFELLAATIPIHAVIHTRNARILSSLVVRIPYPSSSTARATT